MIEWASQHVSGPTWLARDAQQLDFPEASFEAVVSQFGVMFFPDKPGAFAQARRVLVPGGHLVYAVWDVIDASDFPAALMQSLAAVLPDNTPDFIVRIPYGVPRRSKNRRRLARGGLRLVGIERVRRRGWAPSARELTEGFCLGTPLRFELQERGTLKELTTALASEMTARLGPGPVEGDLAALVITAQK